MRITKKGSLVPELTELEKRIEDAFISSLYYIYGNRAKLMFRKLLNNPAAYGELKAFVYQLLYDAIAWSENEFNDFAEYLSEKYLE